MMRRGQCHFALHFIFMDRPWSCSSRVCTSAQLTELTATHSLATLQHLLATRLREFWSQLSTICSLCLTINPSPLFYNKTVINCWQFQCGFGFCVQKGRKKCLQQFAFELQWVSFFSDLHREIFIKNTKYKSAQNPAFIINEKIQECGDKRNIKTNQDKNMCTVLWNCVPKVS